MSFAPIAPTIYVPPTRIAADTYVIHQVQFPLVDPPPLPDQSLLDQIVAATAVSTP